MSSMGSWNLEGAVFFSYWDLVTLNGFWSPADILCVERPVSPLQPANNQRAATCIHPLSNLFKCPPKLLVCPHIWSFQPIWSHQQTHLWYLHRTSAKRCVCLSRALHWPFFPVCSACWYKGQCEPSKEEQQIRQNKPKWSTASRGSSPWLSFEFKSHYVVMKMRLQQFKNFSSQSRETVGN